VTYCKKVVDSAGSRGKGRKSRRARRHDDRDLIGQLFVLVSAQSQVGVVVVVNVVAV
jgi:hypothetical protein